MKTITEENRIPYERPRPFDRGAIRLAAFDLDGTLINGCDPVHPAVRDAVKALSDSGVTVAVSSGRCTVQIRSELRTLFRYLVCVNGAYVVDTETGKLIVSHPISPETVRAIRSTVRRCHGAIYLHREGPALTTPHSLPFILREARRIRAQMGRSVGLTPFFERLATYYRHARITLFPFFAIRLSKEPCYKFQCYFHSTEARLHAVEAFRTAGLTVLTMSDGTVELTAAGVTKAAALKELADRLGFSEEGICAFGDSENDREMLTHAGHAVVMGNADPALFSLADTVAPTVEEDGAAKAIRQLFGV